MEALSDKRLMQVWVSNPYYQYFCGETHFQHRPPVDPTSLIKWRHQSEIITSTKTKTVAVDLGYRRKHDTNADVIHRGRKLSKHWKKRLRRRSALETIIGHMKVDGLLERCYLKGANGDAIHAILC